MDNDSPDRLELGTDQPREDREDTAGPIPFDDSETGAEISHSPLNLGDSDPPVAKPVEKPKVPEQRVPITSSAERITGCKTFFTKLHGGAIDFLNEQITEWLAANPNIVIKRTNSVVGDVAAKKTEPNLIITVWY